MKIRFTGLLVLMSLFLLSACGQKGPLYLEKSTSTTKQKAVSQKDAALPDESDKAGGVVPDSIGSSTGK